MRKLFLFAFATAAFTISSCNKQEIDPNDIAYHAKLSAGNEVPARASQGYGVARGTYNTSTKVLILQINYYNLNAALTAWHIHKAPAGVNGPVIHNFGTPAPTGFTFTSAPLTTDQENDLFTGNYYVNLHTSVFPGGEIRGQLLKQ